MTKGIRKITQIVESAENGFEKLDFANVDAVSMFNLTLQSIDITLKVSRDAEHNADYTGIYDALIKRTETLQEELNKKL